MQFKLNIVRLQNNFTEHSICCRSPDPGTAEHVDAAITTALCLGIFNVIASGLSCGHTQRQSSAHHTMQSTACQNRAVSNSFDLSKACAAGVQILAQQGNAVDAAITTALCQGILSPAASGLGGGHFMVIRSPDGSSEVIDAREPAPAAASQNMFSGQLSSLVLVYAPAQLLHTCVCNNSFVFVYAAAQRLHACVCVSSAPSGLCTRLPSHLQITWMWQRREVCQLLLPMTMKNKPSFG